MPDFFAADSWESGLSNSVALCEAHRPSIAFRLAEMNDHLSKTERIASPKRQVSSCKIVTILFYLSLFTKKVFCFQKSGGGSGRPENFLSSPASKATQNTGLGLCFGIG